MAEKDKIASFCAKNLRQSNFLLLVLKNNWYWLDIGSMPLPQSPVVDEERTRQVLSFFQRFDTLGWMTGKIPGP